MHIDKEDEDRSDHVGAYHGRWDRMSVENAMPWKQ